MKMKVEQPKVQTENLDRVPLASLASKEEVHDKQIQNAVLEYLDVRKVSLERTVFRNVTILESSLEQAECTDVIFEKCDFSNVHFVGSFFHRVIFRNCKLIGTDFSDSRLQHAQFLDCIGDYANFRFAKFKQARFEDCSLKGSDYCGAAVHNFEWNRCNLDRVNLSQVKLNGVDLSDCHFDSLIVNPEDLVGCKIAAHQAMVFVGLLGMVVE